MRFYKTLQCCCLFLFYVLLPSVGLFLSKHRRKLLLRSIVAVILRERTRDDTLSVGIPYRMEKITFTLSTIRRYKKGHARALNDSLIPSVCTSIFDINF